MLNKVNHYHPYNTRSQQNMGASHSDITGSLRDQSPECRLVATSITDNDTQKSLHHRGLTPASAAVTQTSSASTDRTHDTKAPSHSASGSEMVLSAAAMVKEPVDLRNASLNHELQHVVDSGLIKGDFASFQKADELISQGAKLSSAYIFKQIGQMIDNFDKFNNVKDWVKQWIHHGLLDADSLEFKELMIEGINRSMNNQGKASSATYRLPWDDLCGELPEHILKRECIDALKDLNAERIRHWCHSCPTSIISEELTDAEKHAVACGNVDVLQILFGRKIEHSQEALNMLLQHYAKRRGFIYGLNSLWQNGAVPTIETMIIAINQYNRVFKEDKRLMNELVDHCDDDVFEKALEYAFTEKRQCAMDMIRRKVVDGKFTGKVSPEVFTKGLKTAVKYLPYYDVHFLIKSGIPVEHDIFSTGLEDSVQRGNACTAKEWIELMNSPVDNLEELIDRGKAEAFRRSGLEGTRNWDKLHAWVKEKFSL